MKYLFAFLLLTGCIPNLDKTEFKYKQRVVIIDGFYAGLKGEIWEEGLISYTDCYRQYKVRTDDINVGYTMVCNNNIKDITEK